MFHRQEQSQVLGCLSIVRGSFGTGNEQKLEQSSSPLLTDQQSMNRLSDNRADGLMVRWAAAPAVEQSAVEQSSSQQSAVEQSSS
jgi:hypothetical protein